MTFTNPIPRSGLPRRFQEASAQRSLRDGDATARMWKKSSGIEQQVQRTSQAVEMLQMQLMALRRRKGASVRSGKIFFRIYRGSTWLKAKVAIGPIITTGDLIVPSNVDTDLTLTSGVAKNWIYVDMTSTTAVFAVSATLPTWAIDKIPIGYVDTTDTTDERQVITQIRKEHIFNPCL